MPQLFQSIPGERIFFHRAVVFEKEDGSQISLA
jgi:hypothetical protein